MEKEIFTIENRSCVGYSCDNPQFILVQPIDEHDFEVLDQEIEELPRQSDRKFLMIAFQIKDWNKELSPWEAPAVFGNESFGNGAQDTLSFIENTLLPNIYKKYQLDENIPLILGGYSLAALFSLWSAYQTKRFDAIAAASPSVWFTGWMEYAIEHQPKAEVIYLSLGDKEEKTRNKVMSSVGECIRKQFELFEKQEIKSILEWNQGNHFQNSEIRCAKGFHWCMNALAKTIKK